MVFGLAIRATLDVFLLSLLKVIGVTYIDVITMGTRPFVNDIIVAKELLKFFPQFPIDLLIIHNLDILEPSLVLE